jgi:hypothetical protein
MMPRRGRRRDRLAQQIAFGDRIGHPLGHVGGTASAIGRAGQRPRLTDGRSLVL